MTEQYIQDLIVEYLVDRKQPCTVPEVFTFLRTEGAVDDPGQMLDPVLSLMAKGLVGRIEVDNNTILFLKGVEDARERLASVLPHLRIMVEAAKMEVPGGEVRLGIIGTNKDGGKVMSSMSLEFLDDLGTLVGEIRPPKPLEFTGGGEKASEDQKQELGGGPYNDR